MPTLYVLEQGRRSSNRVIAASLVGAVWPGLFAEGDATQVSDEYVGQTESRTGSPEHSVTYGAGSYDGIGTAADGVLEIPFLNVNGKLPVGVDKGAAAAEGVQPLVLSG